MNTGAPSSVEPGARPVEQQQPPQDPIDAGAGASEEMPSNSEEEEQEEEEGTDEDEDMSDEEAHAMLSRMVQEAEAAPGVVRRSLGTCARVACKHWSTYDKPPIHCQSNS